MVDKHVLMGSGSINKALAWLAAPAIIGLVIQTLYGLVDSVFVGRGLGEEGVLGLAALAVAFPVAHLLLSAAAGVGVGGSSYISRGFGASDSGRVKKGVGNMIIMAFVVGIICTIIGLVFLKPILFVFGATETTLPFAYNYMFWIILGCTFQILTVTINAIVMAEGNSLYSMSMYAVSSVTNIILDYIFIFEFGWGIQGAAIATIMSQMLSVLLLIFYLYKISKLKFSLKWLKFDKTAFWGIGKVGFSEFLREGSLAIMFIIVIWNVNMYGDDSSVAIYGLINRIFGFVIIPAMGVVQGMIPLTGFNYGAKKYDRVRKILKTASLWAILISFVLGAMTYIFTAELFSLFITDTALIDEAVIAYWIADLSIPIVAFQIVGSAFMQALGQARASLILALIRQFSIIPVLAVIPYFLGLMGVWVAFPIADLLATAITLWFVLRQLKSLKKEEKLHTMYEMSA
ncbi:MATE family efflux transporter [Methanimicrococcus blatticola]|uniref:Multidrug export protein MepA n=1 Tax=Methanimicrococcus blatticola TaxID=91560 RepID=A0A484F5C1_9EURY|nr:MATE family efflux transporter [Methanimicrococcus blatticola]MBZ3936409.1 MATE family efflux transporter [Methanimicrococcus blatticola]MCC2509571.1 MATE family efflux transporter [Methanimicrococcus blatticola]TDQ67620.1 putative MATE family efflux protein [Methanimicrococcus blatticola]